jgi:hypothetical protein
MDSLISGWIPICSRIFEGNMSATILIGASITIREAGDPGQWMEASKIRDLLSRAFAVIKDHASKTYFKDYSIASGYACDIDNTGMLLQRLEEGSCADGLYADVSSISRYIESLADDIRQQDQDPSWLEHASSRVYAFAVIDGFDACILDSLIAVSSANSENMLSDFDYKSLASLLNCRPLACELEKLGFDIGLEVYLAFRSGDWLYFGYDEIYQEGLVICEHEAGFNPLTSQLLDALKCGRLDDLLRNHI